jgi:hypothetical protein
MNTAEFFMENFGRHFCAPTGNAWADVGQVLRGAYPMIGKATKSRMQSGWAIVRPGSAALQLDLDVPEIQKSRMTRNEAFAAEAIFMSVDKRMVRICTNSGAKTEDWTTKPPTVKEAKK